MNGKNSFERLERLPAKLLHGGDYNPEQWLDRPDILKQDIDYMKAAHINVVTLGVFSWSVYEPEEGEYYFEWLDAIMDRLYENGIYVILATPSGARPAWLDEKYPEVMRVNEYGLRNTHGIRHNHCMSSPIYRRKVTEMNEKLALRYGRHPALILWHVSNELGGSCYCELCRERFRQFLEERYHTVERLNQEWWTTFWSHRFGNFTQIDPPSPRGESSIHGLNLDWKRFASSQQLDFCKEEICTVRSYSALPVTTNLMAFFRPLDYFQWAKVLDFVSWDCYPDWHSGADELDTAAEAAACHSLVRSLKRDNFLMMESTPSVVNWREKNRLKRPGMHELSSLQAVACGSDSVQYFQWRKSRGSSEKYHGAVVDHKYGENTRVFRDVARLGERLLQIAPKVLGTCNQARIAMIFDWENWWAVEDAYAVDNHIQYQRVFLEYFRPLWEMGVDVDIVDMDCKLDSYSVVIAPLNYLYRKGYADSVQQYVEQGGCYVTTCWSGEVDDTDLVYLEKHPLEEVLGIAPEEMDVPDGYCENSLQYQGQTYQITGLCGLVHAKSAEVLAEYQHDFYAGYPALTRNIYGKGEAYYIASMNEMDFLRAFYQELLHKKGLECRLNVKFPMGVTVNERRADDRSLWFLQNFNRTAADVEFLSAYTNIETGEVLEGKVTMGAFECMILEEGIKS